MTLMHESKLNSPPSLSLLPPARVLPIIQTNLVWIEIIIESLVPHNINIALYLNMIFCFSPSEDDCWPQDQSHSSPYIPPPRQELTLPRPRHSASQEYQSSPPAAPASPPAPAMVSRRAIISRSRDDLQHHLGVNNKNFTGEDQWFSKEKLYKVSFLSVVSWLPDQDNIVRINCWSLMAQRLNWQKRYRVKNDKCEARSLC